MSEFSVYLEKSKIRPGMILAADLYDRFGNILICSGTVLDNFFIDKITGNDVLDEIAIVDRRSDISSDRDFKEKSVNSMKIDIIRKKTSKSVKKAIDNLKADNNQSMTVLFEIVERIIEEKVKIVLSTINTLKTTTEKEIDMYKMSSYMIMAAYYKSIMEIFYREMDRASAALYVAQVDNFYRVGWQNFFRDLLYAYRP